MLVFRKHVDSNAQDVLFFVLNSNTLLNGVYVLTGLALSGDLLFSLLVLFRRFKKGYRVNVRVSDSWAGNTKAMNLCLITDIDRLKLNYSVYLVRSIILFCNATQSI